MQKIEPLTDIKKAKLITAWTVATAAAIGLGTASCGKSNMEAHHEVLRSLTANSPEGYKKLSNGTEILVVRQEDAEKAGCYKMVAYKAKSTDRPGYFLKGTRINSSNSYCPG